MYSNPVPVVGRWKPEMVLFGNDCDWIFRSINMTGAASATANLAYYFPFQVAYPRVLTGLSYLAVTASGNYDMGLYAADGTKIGSSGAVAVTTGKKTWSPSGGISLAPGVTYYAAWSASAGHQRVNAGAGSPAWYYTMSGIYQQASAHPLPSPATLTTSGTSDYTVLLATFSY